MALVREKCREWVVAIYLGIENRNLPAEERYGFENKENVEYLRRREIVLVLLLTP